jgi:hypothetical protein
VNNNNDLCGSSTARGATPHPHNMLRDWRVAVRRLLVPTSFLLEMRGLETLAVAFSQFPRGSGVLSIQKALLWSRMGEGGTWPRHHVRMQPVLHLKAFEGI